MEGRNRPVTNYQSSSAVSPLPNSYYNYQPNPYDHRQPLPDPVPCNNKLLGILLTVGLSATVILTVSFFVLLYLYERERPDFRLDSFSLSNFTFTNGSRVSMISEVQLTARNPNFKYSLDYDHIVTSIFYKHQPLSQAFLPPFSQGEKHKTYLVPKFAGDGSVVDKWVVDEINEEIAMSRSVGFDFWFFSSIVWGNDSCSADTLEVLCKDLVVGIPSNGSPGRLTGKPKDCDVGKASDDGRYISHDC